MLSHLLAAAALAAQHTGGGLETASNADEIRSRTCVRCTCTTINQDRQIQTTLVKFDKYQAELLIPEDGLFSGEEIDVEFRVTDTTRKDEIEQGFKGVGGIEATARMSMPSMEGMPEAKPKVHREGVPGNYGIELFFPHGGDYLIDLELKLPDDSRHHVQFLVLVGDERPEVAPRTQPYVLEIVEWPEDAMAGSTVQLSMRVKDTKSGETAKSFDVAHEREFHLLLASKDLNWFAHEHPTMARDGTWHIPIVFPAGTEYWVYADVAPAGKGSRVLIGSVTVKGPKPNWDTEIRIADKGSDGGLVGQLTTVGAIQVGRSAILQVALSDEQSGEPAGDTVPWLGAFGHMMIFRSDGRTVVHSHPEDSTENQALVKKGIVRFSARFPKPGVYKVYVQVDWRGAVRTIPFAIEVP